MLEPRADGFRNYLRSGVKLAGDAVLDRAYLLNLTAPEMTVLVGGMRALGTNVGRSEHGVFTDRRETLTNDFFVNLLAPGTEWKASQSAEDVFEIRDVATGDLKDGHRGGPGLRLELPAWAISRSTAATTGRRSSCATSSPRG